MARKRMTIDHLAAIVANGFQALQDEMREGFLKLTGRLGAVEGRLDAVEVRQEEHSRTLNRIERKLDSTIARVDGHEVRIERLERRRPAKP